MNSNWSYSPETLNLGQNLWFFVPCDLEVAWIQTWVTVRKRSIRVKIGDFLSSVTLKFDRWPWKTIEHLFYAASSFVHHAANLVARSRYCHCHWTLLKLVNVRKHPIWVKIDFFALRDLEIWWMTLKNNRASLLYYIKLCASFQSHWWIQTGVTVRKCSIRVKIGNFCPVWPQNLTEDLEQEQSVTA